MAASIGGWSARHRWAALLIWVGFVVTATLVGNAVGTQKMEPWEGDSGDSRKAATVLAAAGFPDAAGESVLIQARGSAVPADFRQAAGDVREAVLATGRVENVRTPYDPEAPAPVSADGRSALVTFDMKGERATAKDRVKPVIDAVAQVQKAHPDLRIDQAGDASSGLMIGDALADDLVRAELLSVPLTFGILLAAFGALLAAVVPLVVAFTAYLGSVGLLALTSQFLHVDSATTNLMLLIGLAVGVDYSLFYIRREREERAKGRGRERALEIAAATSGRAVLISGVTVIVAMAGMFLTGNGVFMGFAQGTILVVLTAMIGSVTVLPAILSLIGDKIEARVVHGAVRKVTGRTWRRRLGGREGGGRVWNAVLTGVLRRPVVSVLLAGAVLVGLSVPAFDLRTGEAGLADLQGDYPVVDTLRRIGTAFPGGQAPAVVVLKARDVTAPEVQREIQRFKERAFATGEAVEPFGVNVNPDRTVAAVSVGLAGSGASDEVSEHAVRTLRERVVPETVGRVAEAYVHGAVAGVMDFNAQLGRTVPLVFTFVLLLAFLLLLASFRSLVAAVTAIVLNLLSVAAAYGVLVAVFQYGWGEDLLNFESTGSIVSWLPLFLFVILFGLSMDYHVFILSRIREAFDRGMPTEQAVTHGIRTTAGVVSSAAFIMVGVFAIFGTMSMLSFKEMGIGLAAAILIDATIVRAVLLPATMKLLGDANWYLPRWLNWLPVLEHEPEDGDTDGTGGTGGPGRPGQGGGSDGDRDGGPDGGPNGGPDGGPDEPDPRPGRHLPVTVG
ncbi:MMPL family transporter [Planomonospora sp. ID91781]|uniref:MMPL family transporter n=1 Tax=Planomonospora sp. ID91781 TaxID=2738135 RepID=UPI0018C3F218|nr:MMPL family transporter [Planomonospora sp. ID91781]